MRLKLDKRVGLTAAIDLLDDYQEIVQAKGYDHARAFFDCIARRSWVIDYQDNHWIWVKFHLKSTNIEKEIADKLKQVESVKRRYLNAKKAAKREY